MKMTHPKTERYEPPCIESFDAACEKGFTETLLNYDENPSMGYGDESEQWF
jgi:hypothetical protein